MRSWFIKGKLVFCIVTVQCLITSFPVSAQLPERSGWWKFDDTTSLLAPVIGQGNELEVKGYIEPVSGPSSGNGAVKVGKGNYLIMDHDLDVNTGALVDEYSLQFDFMVPAGDVWYCFFQTRTANTDDGDFFINPGGNIGVAAIGYSAYAIQPGEWYRLIITVRNGSFFRVYLDGQMLTEGVVQPTGGRFALTDNLLIFADNDGEDAPIICSELAIWATALSWQQVRDAGGYGHDVVPEPVLQSPYLQAPGIHSMVISWYDTASSVSLSYGTDSSLLNRAEGTSDLIFAPYRWQTVRLDGLDPGTRYYYRIGDREGETEVWSFRTLPDTGNSGIIRFLILGDTHASDTAMACRVIRAARETIEDRYGPDIENHIAAILHSGDIVVSGNSTSQYSIQYFSPMIPLSPWIPSLVVAGNHEGEDPLFYRYMQLEKISAFPDDPGLKEKIWQVQTGNVLIIGLNTNISASRGPDQTQWLDNRLAEAEDDPSVKFIFLVFHHPPYSELWFETSTFDAGTPYVKNKIFSVIKKYSKVRQVHYGHTHGFERGTVTSGTAGGDFRIICGGGGGGPLDNWGEFVNYDYPDIHISLDHYFFQILEIDMENGSFRNEMISLGDGVRIKEREILDSWYYNEKTEAPVTPALLEMNRSESQVLLTCSEYAGQDSLMTIHLLITEKGNPPVIILDSLIHMMNIYGVDNDFIPVDRNKYLDPQHIRLNPLIFKGNKSFEIRIRYRNCSLKWSEWSDPILYLTLLDDHSVEIPPTYILGPNIPNPCLAETRVPFRVPPGIQADFRLYDSIGNRIGMQTGASGTGKDQSIILDTSKLPTGLCFYSLITPDTVMTRKLIKE